MDVELIDRWDDLVDETSYLTVVIGNGEKVDIKRNPNRCFYIMDCSNGFEVYKDDIENGYRNLTRSESNEILQFAREQFEAEAELDRR